MCSSFQSLINSIEINDVPAAATILEELSTPSNEWNTREALRKAIEKKSLQLLTLLCNSGIFVRHIDSIANELIQKCVSVDFLEGIKFLLSKGINVQHDRNEYTCNPLLQCVREDKLEVLKYFLTVPEINKNPNPNQSLIMQACIYQSVNVLSYLVSSDPRHSINVIGRNTCYTPLHECIMRENITCAKILVEAGANVNIVGSYEGKIQTPIVMAADKGMPSVVMYLMDHGANIHISARNPNTLLHYLARSGNTSDEMGQCVDKLIKAGVPVNKVNIRNETPIYLAAHRSNIAVLKALIQGKCNLNIRCGNQRNSPLSASVSVGNTETTELLLKAGCNVDLIDGTGDTPFVAATSKANVDLMKLLMSHGANVNVKDHRNKATPALSVAVKAGDSDLTKMLLIAGADADITDDKGRTPLCIAIENNRITLTQMLLTAGVDANITDDRGRTPLCLAIKKYINTVSEIRLTLSLNSYFTEINRFSWLRSSNRMSQTEVFEFVKILIEAGANVNQVCQTGERCGKTSTPVFMAADKEMFSVIMFLIDHGANPDINTVNQDTLLHFVARSKETFHEMDQCVDKIIEAGVSVNQVNTRNETPLYLAVLQSNKAVLEALINANCDLNTLCGVPLGLSEVYKPPLSSANLCNISRDKLFASNNIDATNKNTALMVAVRNNHTEITDMLLKAGADTNVKDENGITVLMVATEKGNMVITDMLLKTGVDPNIKDNYGRTALFYVCFIPKYSSQEKVLKWLKQLVDAGAYIEETYQNEEGPSHTLTPIFAAAKNQMPRVVIYLMELGANIQPDIENQNTLLHYLARSEDISCEMIQCVDMLIKAGLSVNKANESNETPLYLAVQSSNNAILEALLKEKYDLNILFGDNKRSLLTESVKNGNNVEVLTTLLNAGCDANLPDGDGETPLLLATRYKFVEQMQLLAQHGAQVNITDKITGRTPLKLAIEKQSTKLTHCLLQAGADVNTKDDHGCTALHYMYSNGSPSSRTWIHLMKLLMIKGCDTSIECSKSHMRDLSHLLLKTNSANLIWFCITNNWYPNGIDIAPTKIFGIEDKLQQAKTLYACDFTKSVISNVWLDEWYTFRNATGQSDDQEHQQLSFHKVICSEDLKSRCRKIIRSCIGSNIKDKINTIEIPTTVKNFILLKDVIPEEYFTLDIVDDDDSEYYVRKDYYDFRYYDHSDNDNYGYSDNDNYDYSDNDNYDYSDNVNYGYNNNDYYDHDGYGDYFTGGISGYTDYDDYDCFYSSD